MSRSLYSFNKKPDTGHRVIETTNFGYSIYCPLLIRSHDIEERTKIIIAPFTSGNIYCPHCGKIV
jgi:hypothetical protein